MTDEALSAADDSSSAAKPEGFFGLVRFLTLVTLLLLIALVAWNFVATLRVEPVDAEARRAELFGNEVLPFGLELSSAVRTPGADVVVTFRRSSDEPAPGPNEVLIVDYRGEGSVKPLFQSTGGFDFAVRLAEWQKEQAFAWHATLRRDDIAWGAWSTRQQVERAFEEGGAWRDSVRVDLSRGEQSRVLFAQWPSEVEADEAELLTLLNQLRMEPPEAGTEAAH